LLHRRSPTAPCSKKLGLEVDKLEIRRAEDIVAAVEALKSEVQASPGTRVSNICQGTRLGSLANTGCRERRNTISPTCPARRLATAPPQARHGARSRLSGPAPHRHRRLRWLRLAGRDLSEPVRHRPRHHRHRLEWSSVLCPRARKVLLEAESD